MEMFGDPMRNPKGWEIKKIKDVSEKFSDGPFGSNLKTEHYENIGVRVIRLQNIGIANFLDDNKAYISENHFSTLQKHTCLPGDVLIGTMGYPNLRACIIPKSIELAVNKADCIQCRPNKNLATSEYICQLLNLPSTLDMASNMIHGETRSRISMGQLSTLRIPLPPLSLQQKFARIVEKVESMRQSQNQSKQQIDNLFSTLMQKAFRGEL
jgi:type I restriction enzyme S subunit